MVKTLKYTTILSLSLLLSGAVFLWWSFATTEGTQRALSITRGKIQNLSYEIVDGNIKDGVTLKDARWQLKNGVVISADRLQVIPALSCVYGKKICIRRGKVEKLAITLPDKKITDAKIRLREINLIVALKANNIAVDELVIVHPTAKPVTLKNTTLTGTINGSLIELDQFTSEWKNLALSGSGSLDLTGNYPIDISGTAHKALGSNHFQTRWTAKGNLDEFNLQSEISSPVNADLSGVISFLDRRRPADMTLQWKTLDLPFKHTNPAVTLKNGSIDITGNWPAYNVRGSSSITGPDIPASTAELTGLLTTKKIDFKPLVINTPGGQISSDGEFSWHQGLKWAASYNATDLNPALLWGSISGNINATGNFSGVLGQSDTGQATQYRFNDTEINGTLNNHPILARGDIVNNSAGWRLNKVRLSSNKNDISINGQVNKSLNLVFSLNQTQALIPEIRGDAHGELKITGEFSKPSIEGSITTSSLKYKNIDLKNARINGIVRNLARSYSDIQFKADSLHLQADANSANAGRAFLRPHLRIYGERADHILDITVSSDPLTRAELSAVGTLDDKYNWRGKINNASSSLVDRTLSLQKPVSIAWTQKRKMLALQPHCWQFDVASVCIKEPAVIGNKGAIKFALDRLPLDSVAELIPGMLPAKVKTRGALQAAGELIWGIGQAPVVTIDSHLTDASIKFNEQVNNKPLMFDIPEANLKVTTTGNKVSAQLHLESDKFTRINADVELSTSLEPYPIQGNVSLSDTQINWINDFLPDVNILDGSLGGNASIAGSLSAPEFKANINLKNGRVKSKLLPIDVNEIEVEMDISDKNAVFKGRALANDAPVTITGNGGFAEQGLNADLRVAGSDIKFQHNFANDVVMSPDLTLRLKQNKIELTGRVDIPKAEITLQPLSTDGVILSADVIVTDDVKPANKKPAIGSDGINTRVQVSLGDQVSVNGYGLNADLHGDFNFAMASKKPPLVTGEIAVDNGDYNAYGQKLKIRDGIITFTGPVEQSALSIEAVREINDVLAGVRIGGTLENPTTSLFSEPPLPEEDILPYIVLGRSLDLNDDDASLLRKATLLLGVNTGQRVSTKLASSLGIDDFSLSAWGTGDDTQILVSGRLNDRLLLRYGVGVFKESNSLYLRYDIADKLYLETTQGLESAVDLFYSFNF